MNASVLTISRRLVLASLLLGTGCQAPWPAGGADGARAAVPVSIRPAFATQAFMADVNHYEIGLIDVITNDMVFRKANVAPTTSSITFSNVPPGTYKAYVEAFGAAGDTYNITDDKTALSTNQVTVTETGSTITTSPLTVALHLVDAGILDIGDGAGNPAQMHGHTTTVNATTSQWVWIPRFQAYQLLNPANCGDHSRFGTADNVRPVGYFTGSRPKSGVAGTDWATSTWGGFYVGKYEASHADATSSNGGSATTLAVQPNVVPWTGLEWHAANLACRDYLPNCRLIGDDEWTALAVWSQLNNTDLKGNTNTTSSNDAEDPSVTFTSDPTASGSGRALTGSGPVTTSLDGTSGGVYDLKGNVAEWTSLLSAGSAPNNWLVKDVMTPRPLPPGGRITGLDVAPGIFRFGLPGALAGTGVPEFGNDGFVPGGAAGNRVVRGGSYATGDDTAGIWHVSLQHAPNDMQPFIGFRPVLRF